MKVQFLLVGVLCVVVKGQNFGYHQAQSGYVPVIKDGVPVDTPEVQAAKAAHFEAYEKARALAAKTPSSGQYGDFGIQTYQQARYQQQPQTSYHQQPQFQQQAYQQQPHYQNDVIYNQPRQQNYAVASYSSALPVDTPEVQQARAAHFAAFSQVQTHHHYRTRRNIYPQYHHESEVPQETPEVQAARIQHLIAHAHAHDEDEDDYYEAPHTGYIHIPIITKKGVPVNTAEVKAARQQHLLAHKLAHTGVQYAGGYSHHIPVIAPNGVPYDTPEVYIAKAEHVAAHAKESTKHNQWALQEGYGAYGYHY